MPSPVPGQRCTSWRLKTRTLQFGPLPALMGIVNVTPDSFSDGGKFFTPSQAVDQALRLEDQGADILDIGGESTRPYSDRVAVDEELRRVVPVLEALVNRLSVPISIDTSKSQVALAALALGAEIINDVTGLEADPEMLPLAVRTQAGVCAMHMQGTPATMQERPVYGCVVSEIEAYLKKRDALLVAGGVAPERICLDPGIGFGKTHEHNLQLIAQADRFVALGRPILIGHSRKAFIGKLIGDKSADRTSGGVGMSCALAMQGVQILRVHDCRATVDALRCFAAAGGLPR